MFGKKVLTILLYRLYTVKRRRIRNIILALVTRLEGGQMYSQTLRRIFSVYHDIEIGMYSYGGCFNLNNIRAYTRIGRYCSFADGVCIFNANHPIELKSTHPFFYEPSFGYVESEQISRRSIVIGNDVWIGQNAVILASVKKIGHGAVIGAGAVVTKDVPEFAILAGNPARILRYRFSEEIQEEIIESQWWNKDIKELKECFDQFLRH